MKIMGTKYKLIVDAGLLDRDDAVGLCQPYAKQIKILPEYKMLENSDTSEEKRKAYEQTLRHEIIHAFFYESGDIGAGDEKLVEWLSVQIPKIYAVFKECGCAGEQE